MDAIKCLKTRKSIRKFQNKEIPKEILLEILECGRWAPSGQNFQPWKIFVVSEPTIKKQIAKCSKYSNIIDSSPTVFLIFLDKSIKYDYIKSLQSIGALFENLLLAIHGLGLGGVWIGEILNQREKIMAILSIKTQNFEFMGAISLGYPNEIGKSSRKPLDSFISWI